MKKILISISLALMACVVGISLASCNDDNNDSHVHDIISVSAKDATCEEDGNIAYYKCSDCDEYFSDAKGENKITDKSSVIVKAKGHDLDKVEAKDANCSDSGNIEYYICSGCDKYFSDKDGKNEIKDKSSVVIVANGHNLNKVDSKAEDCLNLGNIEYYVCDVCNKYFSDKDGKKEISAESVVIPAKGHKGVLVPVVAADCENDGNIAYYKCENCNKLFSDEACKNEISADSVIVKAHHNLNKVDAKVEDCLNPGNIDYYVCSVCDKYFSDAEGKNEIKDKSSVVIVANGHNLDKVDSKAEDCLNPGNIEYYVCSVCDKYFSDKDGKKEISAESVVIPAKGHKGVLVPVVAADCENDGNIAYYKCENCNKLFSDEACKNEISADSVIVKAHHNLNKVDSKAEDCLTPGNIEYYVCSICDKYFSDAEGKNEIVDKESVVVKAHHSIDKVEAVEASCDKDGNIEYYKCSVCGKYFGDAEGKNEIVDKSSVVVKAHHNLDKVEAVEASCDKDGNIEYYKCSVCGKYFSDAGGKNEISDVDIIDLAKGHSYIANVISAPTTEIEGSASISCSNCDYSENIELPIISDENIAEGIYNLNSISFIGTNATQVIKKLSYLYSAIDLEEPMIFEVESSARAVNRFDLINGSTSGKFLKTYLSRNTSIVDSGFVISLLNVEAGWYKLGLDLEGIDLTASISDPDGNITDVITSSDNYEALFEAKKSGIYVLIFHSASASQDVNFTIERTEIPTISLSEPCTIGIIAGGNVSGGGTGGSISVLVAEDVVEGNYNVVLFGTVQVGRGHFDFIVNGEKISSKNGMINVNGRNQIAAYAEINVKGGDIIEIISMNLQSIANVQGMLVEIA